MTVDRGATSRCARSTSRNAIWPSVALSASASPSSSTERAWLVLPWRELPDSLRINDMTTAAEPARRLCLVTGATGYVGGRLVPQLLAAGYRVRCLVRDPERLRDHPGSARSRSSKGTPRVEADLDRALQGVTTAYYLVHSLGSDAFESRDRETARGFGAAAERADVESDRLSRWHHPGGTSELSPHLRSRAEVGEILLDSGVPTAVLQAAVILGSGSASFEMLRYLTERLPGMITPKWVTNRIQPIAIRDVLRYLVAALDCPGPQPGLRHRRAGRSDLRAR